MPHLKVIFGERRSGEEERGPFPPGLIESSFRVFLPDRGFRV